MYKFKITIDKTKVTGTNTNFVYLFSELCSSIPAGFWTHVTDTVTGLDIRFFDTNGVTELKREVVLYSAGTSKVEAWVQIPSLGTSVNKEIWCQYGGPTVANSTAVWSDVHTEAAYHLNGLTDSSGNGCDASIASGSPAPATGKIGNAYVFNDSNLDYLQVGTHANLNLTTVGSLSAWVKGTQAGHHSVIFGKGNYGIDRNGYTFDAIGNLNLELANASGYDFLVGANNIGDGNWHYVVGTWDSSTMRLYVDGIARETMTETVIPVSNVYDLLIGKAPGYPQTFSGYIDEARINSSLLNANWIATEYANQNDPATFSSSGSEEVVSSDLSINISDNISVSELLSESILSLYLQILVSDNISVSELLSESILSLYLQILVSDNISTIEVISLGGLPVFNPYIYIPYLTGSYLQYLHYPYTIEIGHLSGGNFVVEDSVVISDNDTYDRWHKWTGTLGLKYLRVRCFSSLMGGEYFTPPANYKQVLIFDPFEYQETIGNTENIQILTEPVNFEASSAKLGQIIKTFEYEESRDFEQDAVLFEVGTGSFGQITKTFEYEESRDFEQDIIPAFQVGAGYSAIMTTVNIS